MFCFRIPAERDRVIVREELLNLRAHLLLFLRQLKCIRVRVQGDVTMTLHQHSQLRRESRELNGEQLTILSRDVLAPNDLKKPAQIRYLVSCYLLGLLLVSSRMLI